MDCRCYYCTPCDYYFVSGPQCPKCGWNEKIYRCHAIEHDGMLRGFLKPCKNCDYRFLCATSNWYELMDYFIDKTLAA